MISETYWTILENANRELVLRFEKLKKARATGDPEGIKQTRMAYLQALQRLNDDVQNALSAQTHRKTLR